MICRHLVVLVVFMGVLVVRRKRLSESEQLGLPAGLGDFVPADWPGGSEYQRYEAWRKARIVWAEEHLPGGAEDVPWWQGEIPDQPWDEVEL